MSQALQKGGLPPERPLWFPRSNPFSWYYNRVNNDGFDTWGDDDYPWTWINMEYLWLNLQIRGLAYEVDSPSDLQLGDIVQWDWPEDDAGYVHSTMVTRIDPDGTIYLSSHTRNRNDYEIWHFAGTPRYIHVFDGVAK